MIKIQKTFSLICLTVVFMVGMMCIDWGASAKINEACGTKIVFEGLVFKNVEGRVLYHAGVLVVILCWLVLCACFLSAKNFCEEKKKIKGEANTHF